MTDTLIFSTTDPEGRVIRLHKKALNHIRQEHPELKASSQSIKAVINIPDFITERLPRQELAYTKISSIDLYLNVYVKMDNTYTEGHVSTAFLQRKPPKGAVSWYRTT